MQDLFLSLGIAYAIATLLMCLQNSTNALLQLPASLSDKRFGNRQTAELRQHALSVYYSAQRFEFVSCAVQGIMGLGFHAQACKFPYQIRRVLFCHSQITT